MLSAPWKARGHSTVRGPKPTSSSLPIADIALSTRRTAAPWSPRRTNSPAEWFLASARQRPQGLEPIASLDRGPSLAPIPCRGYMVIRNVLPASTITNAVREIAAFAGADLTDSATWYGGDPQLDGVVPMHQAQSLWDIRQCPNLYQVF